MFYNCGSLKSLDLSSFKTEKVTDMECMFQGCSLLTSLDLRTFNAANASYTYGMFDHCPKLMSCGSSDGKIVNAFANKSQ